jgi:hypothetical protein
MTVSVAVSVIMSELISGLIFIFMVMDTDGGNIEQTPVPQRIDHKQL